MKVGIRFLFTVYLWSALLITILPCFFLYSLVWIITMPFDRRRIIPHYATCLWAALYFAMAPGWKLDIEGKEDIKKGSKYVLVSNHESLIDILLLMQLFIPFRWITKIEMSRVPVLGWVIIMNKYIPVKRGDKDSKEVMLEMCQRSLNENIPVFFFPEGTRSSDGSTGPFRDGAFVTAMENNVPIRPIVIDGPYRVLPKKGFLIRAGQQFRIKVLSEIKPDEIKDKTPAVAADYVREIIVKEKMLF